MVAKQRVGAHLSAIIAKICLRLTILVRCSLLDDPRFLSWPAERREGGRRWPTTAGQFGYLATVSLQKRSAGAPGSASAWLSVSSLLGKMRYGLITLRSSPVHLSDLVFTFS